MNRRALLAIPAAGLAAVFGSHWLFSEDQPRMTAKERRAYVRQAIRRGKKDHPMKVWIDSPACNGRRQCNGCRRDKTFQAKLPQFFEMPDCWPECPHGITAETLPDSTPDQDTPEWYHDRRDICLECDASCWSSPCRRNKAIRRPNFVCPRNLFSAHAS